MKGRKWIREVFKKSNWTSKTKWLTKRGGGGCGKKPETSD